MRADHDTTAQAAGGLSPAMQRTASFLALGAGLLLLGGWLNIRPTLRQRALVGEEEQAKVLFPELADASKAASLEIVSFDDETATLKPFKVVRSGGCGCCHRMKTIPPMPGSSSRPRPPS